MYWIFTTGIVLLLLGGMIFALLGLQNRSKARYADRRGPVPSELHPAWLYRDTRGTVYTSRNDRQG